LVLVKRGSEISGAENVWDMTEFFVLRGYRRRGIGTHIAHEMWRRFPGLWEVHVMESNIWAHEFWALTIAAFTGAAIHPDRVEIDGKCWKLFLFESLGAAG
jgi:predicted acetyltransferase